MSIICDIQESNVMGMTNKSKVCQDHEIDHIPLLITISLGETTKSQRTIFISRETPQ